MCQAQEAQLQPVATPYKHLNKATDQVLPLPGQEGRPSLLATDQSNDILIAHSCDRPSLIINLMFRGRCYTTHAMLGGGIEIKNKSAPLIDASPRPSSSALLPGVTGEEDPACSSSWSPAGITHKPRNGERIDSNEHATC